MVEAKKANAVYEACGVNEDPEVSLVPMVNQDIKVKWAQLELLDCLVRWDVKVRPVTLAILEKKDLLVIAVYADFPEVLVMTARKDQSEKMVFVVHQVNLVFQAIQVIPANQVTLVLMDSMVSA